MTAKKLPDQEPALSTRQIAAFYDDKFNDISTAIIVYWVNSGKIVTVNSEAEELTGFDSNELKNKSLDELFSPPDQMRIKTMAALCQSREANDFKALYEHNLLIQKRSRRKVHCDVGIRKSSTTPGLIVLTLHDISELKTRELDLRQAHEYTNNIINSVSEMMIVINHQGKIISTNASVALTIGYDNDALIGQSLQIVFPDIPLETVIHGSLPNLGLETLAKRKNNTTIPVVLTASVLKGPLSQSSDDIVIVALDVTERKAAEMKIAEQQMMLVQAAKMSSLGEMASSIAHEINNPLQVIIGTAELLDMASQNGQVEAKSFLDGLHKIDQMAQRIDKIIHGLQALSRDQRSDDLSITLVSAIINDTLELCEQRIKTSINHFAVKQNDDSLSIKCRPTQISQVLLNLLNNSCDAILGQTYTFIEINVQEITGQSSRQLEIAVKDSGHGVAPEVLGRLFTPFFTTKPVGKGTGLGLSVSKSLIESHGGTLYLDQGCPHTRFVIRLPLSTQDA